VELKPGEARTLEVALDVPTPAYADEFAPVASASVVPAPSTSGASAPFGVPSTLSSGGGTP
jgi:hypothetical protein